MAEDSAILCDSNAHFQADAVESQSVTPGHGPVRKEVYSSLAANRVFLFRLIYLTSVRGLAQTHQTRLCSCGMP